MRTVLHLTPHLSGGLGRVLLSTLKNAKNSASHFSHEIIVFDDLPANSIELFKDFCDCIHVSNDYEYIKSRISQADIVQLEWWNHALIYRYLFLLDFPASRIVTCCHVSGFCRPQIINKNVIEFSDIFLSVTKATKAHYLFNDAEYAGQYVDKLRFMTFPIDVDRFENVHFKKHDGFNVGYVGTVDYSKLHCNFLSMSASTKIPNAKFIVCGEDVDGKIEQEAKRHSIDVFRFLGFQSDIRAVFEMFDIFAYPLNDRHFGSGEQVILEAMYAGLPVVAFSNPAEKEIIANNETGILVSSEQEYVKAIEYLYHHPEERVRLGQNARRHIQTHYFPSKCFEKLDAVYREMLLAPKKSRAYNGWCNRLSDADIREGSELGAKLFIESLGSDSDEFLNSYAFRNASNVHEYDEKISCVEPEMKTKTKGSLYQYLYFFSSDPYLNFWAGLIKQKEGEHSSAIEYFDKAMKASDCMVWVNEYVNRSKNTLQASK